MEAPASLGPTEQDTSLLQEVIGGFSLSGNQEKPGALFFRCGTLYSIVYMCVSRREVSCYLKDPKKNPSYC